MVSTTTRAGRAAHAMHYISGEAGANVLVIAGRSIDIDTAAAEAHRFCFLPYRVRC